VRDEDDGVRVVGEVLLEPVARLEVEMVGRLVEQQQVGPSEQQLRQRERICQPPEKVSVGLVELGGSKPSPRSTVATFRSMV
jgi:hypothetical protein